MPLSKTNSSKRVAPRLAIVLGVLALLVLPLDTGWSDDTFLFRVQSGKPYVWLILDSSSSMNLSAQLGGAMVDANGDDPRSTFHQAKSAVYEVFNNSFEQSGDFIHYGLMTYNQDGLRVRGKHWVYEYAGGNNLQLGSGGGVAYPASSERLVFGANFPVTATPDQALLPMFADDGFGTVLGSCTQPINLTDNRAEINRFAKLHPLDEDAPFDGFVDDMAPTKMWIEQDGLVYELVVEKHSASGNFLLGQAAILVDFTATEYDTDCVTTLGQTKAPISFNLVQPFLFHDLLGADNAIDIVEGAGPIQGNPPGDGGGGGGTKDPERQAGLYNYQDYTARAVCGDDRHPFTGAGAEMNYDGGIFPAGEAAADFPNVDPYEVGNPGLDNDELTLKFATELNTAEACVADGDVEMRTLDVGDMLPYHWERTNREAFNKRLAPNWTPGKDFNELDFGIASYFRDVPNDAGFLELINPDRKPIMAFGDSPVGEALVDWRCFYLGEDQPGGKCRNSEQPFGRGWDYIAPQCDLEWGCRKPFIIVISDGENNCFGENPAADTANLRRNRIKAWVINFGGPDSRDLRTLARNTGGEYIELSNRDQLLDALQNILGEIIEETRAFASAVVPTVQAEEADKVFISNFKPLNQASVWPGNVQAFLKPVPIDGTGRPDTTIDCGGDPDTDPASECFLWNAGEEMVPQVTPDISNQFGNLSTQRRVYYSRLTTPGNWPNVRRFVAPVAAEETTIAYDLWRGLGLTLANTADGSLDEATEDALEADANEVIENMMALKTDDNGTPDDVSDDTNYILGDIFHSDPLIVGTPVNSKFFALNLEDDGTDCGSPASSDPGNPSYRCFFRRHQNRRKIVLVGSNDGMVHAIDGGIYRTSGGFADEFDRGTGKEVFAWMPRDVMPTVKSMYGGLGQPRNWTVDGSLTGIDAFIDPVADSASFPDPADREWRTVIMGGLRRGGTAYYALDVTQPDYYDADAEPTITNGYVPSCSSGGAGCGPLDYPSQLWEFRDSVLLENPPREIAFDKDLDGLEDLASSWSTPSLGLMKVCTAASCDPADPAAPIEDRYVAIVGGGLDKTNSSGNWVYIIDIETGKSIYKRQLVDSDGVTSGGSVPAETAAVDTDGDGYLDRVYVGTTRGFVYRIDLRGADGEVPAIVDSVDWPLATGFGVPEPVDVQRITDTAYRPHLIFKAQPDSLSAGPASRAIYYRPTVIFSAALGQYVIAFGTGDRENLWSSDGVRGQFYLFKDDIDIGDFDTFYTENDLVAIDSETDDDTAQNLLTDPTLSTKGWNMLLRENERLITSPFAVSGVVVFTVFSPDVEIDLRELTCSRTGRSRVFGVTATNGNGLLFSGGSRTRWFDVADFVTEPYVEQSQTKNPDEGGDGATADDLTADHLAIMDELKKLFPSNCKFANYRLDIKTLSSDTGIHLIAPIPICIVEKNWKEF